MSRGCVGGLQGQPGRHGLEGRPGERILVGQVKELRRRERDYLASQLEAALSHLRRLTIDHAELRRELETARAITRIGKPDTAAHG
jgi:hypothetical protein